MIKNSYNEYRSEIIKIIHEELEVTIPDYFFEYEEDTHFGKYLTFLRVDISLERMEIRSWNKTEAIKLFNQLQVINLDPQIDTFTELIDPSSKNSLAYIIKNIQEIDSHQESRLYLDGISRTLKIPKENKERIIKWNITSDYEPLNLLSHWMETNLPK